MRVTLTKYVGKLIVPMIVGLLMLHGSSVEASRVQQSNLESFEIMLDSYEIAENLDPGGGGYGVGDFIDDQGNAILYELVTGEGDNGNAFFEIERKTNNSQLQAITVFDFETQSSYSIRVKATLADSLLDERALVIEIENVEEPPTTIELSNTTIAEGQAVGTVVGILSAAGGSVAPEDIAFNLISGGENFTIVGNEVRTAREFDFETDPETYTIEVVAQGEGDSAPQEFTITLTDVDESVAPTAISLTNTEITEGDAGITVGTLSSNGTEPVTFSLVAGEGDTDNGKFEIINQTTLRTAVALDFEDPAIADGLSVRVQASNTQGNFADNFTINVNESINLLPTAVASANPTSGEAPLIVTFDGIGSSDTDGTIDSYSWDFGDGNSSNEASPSHTYTTVGEYTATLTVADDNGAEASAEVIITVSAPVNQSPVANAGQDQRLIDNDRDGSEPVTLNGSGSIDPDGNIEKYSWRENDAQGTLLAEGVQPTIPAPVGDNLIALVVEDNSGATASDAVMIYVDAPPLADAGEDITVTDEDGDGEEDVELDGSASSDDDGTIDNYTWSWINGTASGAKVTASFPIGTTEVTLEVTDNDGISHSDATSVQVNAPANQAPTAITVATPTSGNAPLTVSFDGSGSTDDGVIVAYNWNFGDGNTSTEASPSHIYATEGDYTATLVVTDDLGVSSTNSATVIITVAATPLPEFTLSTNSVLVSEDFSESQQVETQLVDATQSVSFTIEPPTLDFATLTADNSNGIYLFDAKPHRNGKADLTIRATNTTNNQTFEQPLSIEVLAVNDAPSFTLPNSQLLVAANSPPQSISNFVTNIMPGPVEAIDEVSQEVSFSVSTTNSDLFAIEPSISSDGTLTYQVAENQAGEAEVSVVLEDGEDENSISDPQNFTLTVEAPQASNLLLNGTTTATIDENLDAGTEVGTLSADGFGSKTYSLLPIGPNNDNNSFSIDDNRLLTNEVFDFEVKNEYVVTVEACSGIFGNSCTNGTFTITIDNVEEPPTTIELEGQTIVENQAVGTEVGTLSASGGSVAPADITFSLTSGGDNFTIVGNKLQTAREFDFETDPETYIITVVAVGEGNSDPQDFTITLTDVDESVAPTEVLLTNVEIAEGDAGITVGTLSSNGTAPVTFSLVAGAGDTDNGKFEIVDGTTLRTTVAIDFEEPTTADGLAVRVQASNTAGSFADNFAITVANVEEPPTDITLNNAAVQENQAGALVGNLAGVGGIGPYTFTLVGANNDNDEFSIEGNQLKTKDGLDFEAGANRTVNIQASNDGSFTKQFTITVTNVEEPPTDITLDKTDIDENQADATVGNLAAEGGVAPFTFTLTGSGNDNSLFAIDGNQLKTNDGLNFEANASLTVEITVNSADGNVTREFTISVNDLDEPPTDIFLSSNSVNENEPRNTVVGTLSATGGSIEEPSFRLVGSNNDNGLFRIDGDQLLTNAVFDREEQDSYTVEVKAVGEGSLTERLAITIDNVNDAPQITVTEDRIIFAEGDDPVEILADITVADDDSPSLSSATLTIVDSYIQGEDELLTDADHQWNNQSGRLTLNGPLSITDMQAALRSVRYQNKQEINPTSTARQIRVVVNDGALNSNAEQIFVLVDNPNEPPVLTNFSVEVSENSEYSFTAADFEANHEDSDDDFPNQIYLESGPSEGALTVDGQEITSEVILASGSRGFLVDFAAEQSMIYTPAENFNGSDDFRWNVYDADNAGNASQVQIEVLPVNDAPEISAPELLVVQEDARPALSDITASDVDGDELLLTLSVTNGGLVPSALVADQVSILEAGETGGKRIQIQGSAENINTILPEITFVPSPETSDQDALAINLTDAPSNSTGSLSAEATVNIRIGTNEAPQLSDVSIDISSGQVFAFAESTFLEAYTDPDNFPTADGFSGILITSLPENGELLLNGEVLTVERIGEEGILLSPANIAGLSYRMTSNEATSDQFGWNATDGGKFADEGALVQITIQLLSISLETDIGEVCQGEPATLTATVAGGTAPFNYGWSCDQATCNISGNTETVTVNPEIITNYQLVVTDANGIQASTAILVNVINCQLVIPSGFTPNGDNVNDTWELQNINTFEQKLVEVYDRYGHRVFFSDNYNQAWDGSYRGDLLPTGTYYYRIELEEGSQSYQGKVTILQ
ncbi:MAG: PKD domain-containing protein [Bacteroidota bacterium]